MGESTGKELARVGSYARSSLSERQQYAAALAAAGEMVPKSFWTKPGPDGHGGVILPRPNPGAILYMLETAAMLGVNPMVGLTNIHIIEGKPSLSANLQSALVREAGHRLRVRVEGEAESLVAIAELVRSDDPDYTFTVHWSHRDAQKAGLLGKDNWKKYERAMLKARAITEVIREGAPEVLMGATYSPDELGAVTDEQGEPITLTRVPDEAPEAASDERSQPPISDAPKEIDVEWWGREIGNVASRDEAAALYQKARQGAVLDAHIEVGSFSGELGQVIIAVGKALAEAEAQADPSEPGDPDEGAPAVLDEEPVEAEVVEDE